MSERSHPNLDPQDYVEVVPFTQPAEADRAFAEWLHRRGLTPEGLGPEDFVIDIGRGLDGRTVKSYRVRGSGARWLIQRQGSRRMSPYGSTPPGVCEMNHEIAALKERAWKELARIDEALEAGEINEEGWYSAVGAILVPAYLAAETPWGGSGKSGTYEDWEYSRRPVVDAIDRPGTFLDVGCANGFLMECVARWSPFPVEPYGLEISPELANLARARLPEWRDRIFVGNALTWVPPHTFTYVRTDLGYVPPGRRRKLVERLLGWCERLIVGVLNEEADARTTEDALRSWGYRIAGRSDRPHRDRRIQYRLQWIDSGEDRTSTR